MFARTRTCAYHCHYHVLDRVLFEPLPEFWYVTKHHNRLLQPHAAQVLSIFRLLGVDVARTPDEPWCIDESAQNLQSHMVQILTGEGKSVTLAVTASFLALNGFCVDCACYSKYLSQRDFDDFEDLFESLGVKKQIFYGTFKDLCSKIMNCKFLIFLVYAFSSSYEIQPTFKKARGKVPEIVTKLLSQSAVSPLKLDTNKRILLIDEVDVFFRKDFYGMQYSPSIELRDPKIDNLLDLIWSRRMDPKQLRIRDLRETAEFKAVTALYGAVWKPLFEEALKGIW